MAYFSISNAIFLKIHSKVFGNQYLEVPTVFPSIRVLRELLTAGVINGRDFKLAATTQGDIYFDSPLSFDSISVNNLNTNEFVSGINIDKWMTNSFRSWSSQPQIVTGHWKIKNAYIDSLYSSLGVNNMDIGTFIQRIYNFNKISENNFKRKCDHVQNLIDDTQKNVLFLSNFENDFKIVIKSQINSIYLFDVLQKNYLLVSSGCETSIYLWNEPSKKYAEISHVNTGVVNEWIHVLDLENQLYLISNNDGSITTISGCQETGSNIWQFDFTRQSMIKIVQFGSSGEFRSMQQKPNSHAYFYALRNSDNQVIEFNMRGAAINHWKIEEQVTKIKDARLRFVPGEANLGLAISDGKSLSLLSTYDCSKRPSKKRCADTLTEVHADWSTFKEKKRALFEKSISNLKSSFNKYKKIFKSRFPSKIDNGTAQNNTQSKNDKLNRLAHETDEKLSAYTLKLISTFEKELNTTTNGTDPHLDENNNDAAKSPIPNANSANNSVEVGSGKFLVDLLDLAEEVIDKNREKHKKLEYDGIDDQYYEVKASKPVTNTQKTTIIEDINLPVSNVTDDSNSTFVGDGKSIVDILDLADEIIEENKENHRKFENKEIDYNTIYEVGSKLNDTEIEKILNSSVVENQNISSNDKTAPQVGGFFGLLSLENALVHAIEVATDAIGGRRHEEEDHRGLFGLNRNHLFGLSNTHENVSSLNRTTAEELDHILSLISIAENITETHKEQTLNATKDEIVGDQFGDLLFKLTPLTDNIFDKIANEIRRRNGKHRHNAYPYEVNAQKSSMKQKNGPEDEIVGDEFGDLLFKLTPFTDDVFDKIADEIRKRKGKHREYSDEYEVGAEKSINENSSKSHKPKRSKIKDFFKKIGHGIVKVYVFGKGKLHGLKDLYKDAKYLYITYNQNQIEDNADDNKSYGPSTIPSAPLPPTHFPNLDYDIDIRIDETKPNMHSTHRSKEVFNGKKIKLVNEDMIKHRNDLVEMKKILPNADKMIESYTVEMIKAFDGELANKTKTNESVPIVQGFWHKIKNGVEKTFKKYINVAKNHNLMSAHNNSTVTTSDKDATPSNSTKSDSIDNKTDMDPVIFEKFMAHLIEIIEISNELENHPEGNLGAPHDDVPQLGVDLFDKLYKKFIPLVDEMSDQIVDGLHSFDGPVKGHDSRIKEREYGEYDEYAEFEGEEPVNYEDVNMANPKFQQNKPNENEMVRHVESHMNGTMQDILQRINELETHHDSTMELNLLAPNKTKSEEISESPKNNQMETTIVSVPNHFLPSHQNGDIIAIKVGPDQKIFIAVSTISENTIKDNHDRIQVRDLIEFDLKAEKFKIISIFQIFEDVIDGKLFQTISCFKPRSLTSFRVHMDTVLAFIQDDSEIKVKCCLLIKI